MYNLERRTNFEKQFRKKISKSKCENERVAYPLCLTWRLYRATQETDISVARYNFVNRGLNILNKTIPSPIDSSTVYSQLTPLHVSPRVRDFAESAQPVWCPSIYSSHIVLIFIFSWPCNNNASPILLPLTRTIKMVHDSVIVFFSRKIYYWDKISNFLKRIRIVINYYARARSWRTSFIQILRSVMEQTVKTVWPVKLRTCAFLRYFYVQTGAASQTNDHWSMNYRNGEVVNFICEISRTNASHQIIRSRQTESSGRPFPRPRDGIFFFPRVETSFYSTKVCRDYILSRPHPNATQFNDYASHMRQMHNATGLHMHEATVRVYIYMRTCIITYHGRKGRKRANTSHEQTTALAQNAEVTLKH